MASHRRNQQNQEQNERQRRQLLQNGNIRQTSTVTVSNA